MKHKKSKERILGSLLAFALALLLVSTLGNPTGLTASLAQQPQPEAAGYSYAFTYQGYLENGSGPVNSTCDFKFSLWNTVSGTGQVGSTLDVPNVTLTDGLFTARLNFGAAAHTGAARWLEITVRCPAGSGSYTTLTPRQELTAAPAALALALPFEAGGSSSGPLLSFWNSTGAALELASQNERGLYVSSAGTDGVYVNQAGSPSTTTPSADKNGFEVAGAQGHGLWVGQANLDGVMIYSAGDDGVTVNSAGGDGLYVGSASEEGVQVETAGGHGVYVANAALHGYQLDSAGHNGVNILQADDDGVYVERAGSPSTITPDAVDDGFEVAGAAGNGLYVGYAGGNGIQVHSAVGHGVDVASAGAVGVHVYSADEDGIYVESAGGHGVYVGNAALHGLQVDSAGYNGVNILQAADDGVYVGTSFQNGVHVGLAYYGLKVDSAWNDGVRVSADLDGVHVESALHNGVHVESAGMDGAYANTTNAAHEWGFYTPDKIYAGTALASGGPLLVVAQSDDGGDLVAGDLVAVSGVSAILPDAEAPVPLVRRSAADGSPVLGVVYRRLVVEEKVQEKVDGQGQVEQQTYSHTNSTDGTVAPGDYLFVVVLGAAQAKVEATAAADLRPGDLLAIASNGQATKATPVTVGEATFYAPGTILGQVLGAAENGLVWVWVNPR
jgi:hypothetical protein